jgi:hypothetical protein
LIEDAIAFAAQAHQGQLDRQGEPYIFHPLRVMLGVKQAGGTDEELVAAALHDVVEDTDTRLEELSELFGAHVAELVDAMSRREGESYDDYMGRCIAGGPGAIRIKTADLTDNSDPERLAKLDPELARTLEARYRGGFEAIERAEEAGK